MVSREPRGLGRSEVGSVDSRHLIQEEVGEVQGVAAILKNDWADKLAGEFEQPYYRTLRAFLIEEYRNGTVYPDMYDIFNALHFTPYAATKVCILGQDPYHGPGQAHGLSFSVKR